MTDWIFPTAFSSWCPGDDGAEDRAYQRAYRSGRLTMGPEVEKFEEEFANYHGRRHAIMVNSGSSANEIAAAAFSHGWYKSGFVAVSAVAWATTYSPFNHQGKSFIVMDVEDDWNAAYLPMAEPEIGCMVVCSILGNPFRQTMISAAALGQIPVLEDNCESISARDAHGNLTGTFGLLSTFSFFYSHQLSAIEGGMILTDDDKLANLCRLLRNHGNAGWGQKDLEDQYDFAVFGYNLRPVETHAAVAREQLKHLDEMIEVRRDNLQHFRAATEYLPIIPQRSTSPHSAPFGLAFECEDNAARRRLAAALRAEGIDCRLPTGGSFLRHQYGAPWRDQKTPRADQIHERGMFLGCAPYPIPELIDRAVKVMKDVL